MVYLQWFCFKYWEICITPTGNDEKDEAERIKLIHKDLVDGYDRNLNDLEKFFLQKFANFGLSLHKADNDMGNWNKLELDTDENNNLIAKPKPCN